MVALVAGPRMYQEAPVTFTTFSRSMQGKLPLESAWEPWQTLGCFTENARPI